MFTEKIFHGKILWHDAKREPQCPPNEAYPNGIDVDVSRKAKDTCKANLPYPARRCGYYIVQCSKCDSTIAITTAGRPDDPRSVTLPCQGV